MSDIIGALDPDVIQMVKFFNKNGHLTHMSCQGHNRTNMSMFWIEFYQSVTENDTESNGWLSAINNIQGRVVVIDNPAFYHKYFCI